VEEALRESEEKYRSTIESIDDLIFNIDKEGYFVDYYAPSASMLYAPSEAFLGKKFDEVLLPPMLLNRFQNR
jgi:PAS domain-containing protein